MNQGFSKIGHCILIAALMIAFGGHWAVLQSVAWATMLVDNARHVQIREAVTQTFDGRHPCAICKSISKARQTEKKQELRVTVAKLNLFFQPHVFALRQPQNCWWMVSLDNFSQSLSHRPPVPPPLDFRA